MTRKPLLCWLLGHLWSYRRAATLRFDAATGMHREVYERIAECDRWECTAVKR